MHTAIYLSVISLLAATGEKLDDYHGDWTKMKTIAPRGYVCYRATEPIRIDGKADEKAWAAAPWTDDFVDMGVTGVPLGGEVVWKLMEDSTVGIESAGFCFYSMGLERRPLAVD